MGSLRMACVVFVPTRTSPKKTRTMVSAVATLACLSAASVEPRRYIVASLLMPLLYFIK